MKVDVCGLPLFVNPVTNVEGVAVEIEADTGAEL